MASIYLVAGIVAITGILIWIVVWMSKSSGRSIAERDSLLEGQSRRERFDQAISRPIARGNELLDRLRNMGR